MASIFELAPPVGGWDTRESLADMPSDRAIILDNWFPSTDKVTLRKGATERVTGMSGNVDSLLEYSPPTGSAKLFAANNGNIYDASSSGAVGSAEASGFSSDQWQSTQVTTAGGHFLFACNGMDTAQLYDGSAFADSTVTGPDLTLLAWCNLHQRRLWFGESGSLDCWYLDVNSITGAAIKFPVGAQARLGGYMMAMGTWTRDGGDGADDVAVFLTSEGEAIVYQGTDPSSLTTWGLVGVFRIGKPIGRRCLIKAGADLIIVTQDGFVSASTILAADRSQAQRVAISAQINKAVNDAVRDFGSLFGWQPIIYPKGAMLIFNIPQSSIKAHQYVFNTITNAPCRFTGLNARCWGLLNDNVYFGTIDGRVMQADSGTSDDGTNISGDALQAFSYMGSKSKKAYKSVEPIFQSNGNPNAALDLNIDFQIRRPTGVAEASPVNSATWGVSKWGVGTWGSAEQIYRGWRGTRGAGRAAALRVRVDTTASQPSWISTNFAFQVSVDGRR